MSRVSTTEVKRGRRGRDMVLPKIKPTPQLWKVKVKVAQLCLTLQTNGLYHPWNSPGQNTGVGNPFPSPGDLPNLGIKPRSPKLQADSLPAEQQGKLKNTGVGNLPLLQGIFLTQESNLGLLRCREILYQLSYQGSPPRLVRCIPKKWFQWAQSLSSPHT